MAKTPRSISRMDCSRCNRNTTESFYCYRDSYEFDVDMAREYVSDGRKKIELEDDDVRFSVGAVVINEDHVPHVEISIPGIVSHIYYPDPDNDGEIIHGHRLIDGHHRACRCLQLKIPFYVYILTEAESVNILVEAPKGARPNGRRRRRIAKRQAKQKANF